MREGRYIADANWINSSIEYNRWFIEKSSLDNKTIDTYDITGKSTAEVADYVTKWVDSKLGHASVEYQNI